MWAGFVEAKDSGMVVTVGAISCAKLQSNHHQQQTITQLFTGRMPFLSPNQQCQSTEGKVGWLTDSSNSRSFISEKRLEDLACRKVGHNV